MAGTPDDVCPYSRPFDIDFSDCVAYYPQRFVARDSSGRVLSPVWTCRHLGTGLHEGTRGHFYPRCRIGNAADREEWARTVGGDRLAAFDEWRRISGPVVEAGVAELIRANREALPAGSAWGLLGPGVADRIEALVHSVVELARKHEPLLERVGFPLDAYERMLSEWFAFVVADGGRNEWRTPPATLDLFPEPARALLDPNYWKSSYRAG